MTKTTLNLQTTHSTAPRPAAAAHLLAGDVASFGRLLAAAERAPWGTLPAAIETEILARFAQVVDGLHRLLDDPSLSPARRARLGRAAQRAVLPWMRQSELGERMYAKPRGYAGDFETIANMYRNEPHGTSPVGRALDKGLRRQAACRAVIHRRGLLAEEIGRALAAAGDTARITSLACGPAAELFDVFANTDAARRLHATCIDIDEDALAHVARARDAAGLTDRIDLHQGNLVHLAFGRQRLDLPAQDLVYSIGLIDYFSDKFVVKLLDWAHGLLRPGGRVVLGNFHPDNPSRALMEHIFEWNLIHRTEADMDRLFAASKFGGPCAEIRFEAEGVNLFAVGVKR